MAKQNQRPPEVPLTDDEFEKAVAEAKAAIFAKLDKPFSLREPKPRKRVRR